MYSCFGLWVDAVKICPRNRPQLCNSIHNSFHKHNMEATLSHMQTHGQIKEWGAKGDRVHSELLAKPLTVCLNESLSVTGLNRPGFTAGGTSTIFCTWSLNQLHASKDPHRYSKGVFTAALQAINRLGTQIYSTLVMSFCLG